MIFWKPPIDALAMEQQTFHMPFETIKRGKLASPDPELIRNYSQQDLLLKSYKLDLRFLFVCRYPDEMMAFMENTWKSSFTMERAVLSYRYV